MTKINYYGQYGAKLKVDEYIHKTFFKDNPRDGFFIECGAWEGTIDSSCNFFEKHLGWKGANIEPHPIYYKKLLQNRPRTLNINVALSDKNGKARFNAIDDTGLSHLSNSVNPARRKSTSFDVQCLTYPALIDIFEIKKVDLMVLDVEGAEIMVLSQFHKAKVLPKVLCVEDDHVGQPAIKKILRDLYTFHSRYFINSYFTLKNHV